MYHRNAANERSEFDYWYNNVEMQQQRQQLPNVLSNRNQPEDPTAVSPPSSPTGASVAELDQLQLNVGFRRPVPPDLGLTVVRVVERNTDGSIKHIHYVRDANDGILRRLMRVVNDGFREEIVNLPPSSRNDIVLMLLNEMDHFELRLLLKDMIDRQENPATGQRYNTIIMLQVPYDQRHIAKEHGCGWAPLMKKWITHPLADITWALNRGYVDAAFYKGYYQQFKVKSSTLLTGTIRTTFRTGEVIEVPDDEPARNDNQGKIRYTKNNWISYNLYSPSPLSLT